MLFNQKTYGLSIRWNSSEFIEEAGVVISEFAKDKVEIESHQKLSFDDAIKLLSQKNTIVTLSSPSIIHLKLENQSIAEAIESFFPGVSIDTFFTQRFEDSLALINKEELNKLLNLLGEQGIKSAHVILEPIALLALQHTTGDDQIQGLEFDYENAQLQESKNTEDYSYKTIDEKNLNTLEYVSFGGSLIVKAFEIEETGHPEMLKANSKSVKEEKTVKRTLVACVGLLLFLSLGNYIYYSHLTQMNKDLDLTLFSSNASQERLDALKIKVSQYQQLRSGLNEISQKQGAYLLDELGKSLPKEIAFRKLCLESPQKIKEGYQIEFDENVLTLEGKTTSTIALNNWIEEISEADLVDDIKLINYEDSKEKRGNFTIKLFLESV